MSTFTRINPDAELTPVEVERHLKVLFNELARAQGDLREARDSELDAKRSYELARARAVLSQECPKVSRKEGGATVDERDAWVTLQIADAEEIYAVASVARANTEDYLRMLRQQAEIIRSLGTSVRQAYEMAGRTT
jgi:hypothetical protein